MGNPDGSARRGGAGGVYLGLAAVVSPIVAAAVVALLATPVLAGIAATSAAVRCDPCCGDAGPCRVGLSPRAAQRPEGRRSWRRFRRLGRWRIGRSPVVTLAVALATLWPTIAALMAARAPISSNLGSAGVAAVAATAPRLRDGPPASAIGVEIGEWFSGYCLCDRCFAVPAEGDSADEGHCRLGR